MELFYYCYKAPKGEREIESENYQRLYQPEYLSEKEEDLIEEEDLVEDSEEEVPTYSTLNDSIKDVEAELEPYIPQLLLPEPESELEPVKEELEEEDVEVGDGKVDDTILLNTDLKEEKKLSVKKRTFKRPSFKWAKKDKKPHLTTPAPEPEVLPEPAPEGANEDELGEISVDPVILHNTEDPPRIDLGCKKISLDSLTEKVKQKDEELVSNGSANVAEVERLQASLTHYQTMVNEQRELVERLQRDNANIIQRLEHTEHANGVAKHDSYLEAEKTKAAYQTKIDELSVFPERLRTAEARYNESENSRAQLQAKLDESNQTISNLNGKIDMLSESINNIREKYHVVSEDNIELSTQTQEHERKILEADQHNKNLIHMVTKKDDAIEAQQPPEPSAPDETELDGKKTPVSELPPPPPPPAENGPPSPSSTTDNNVSEEDKPTVEDLMDESESETETESESDEEVDWSEMLKDAEANKKRLGMDNIEESSGESDVDENGVRVKVKSKSNGLSTQDMINRMATNELLGYDEFGRPITSKTQLNSSTGLSSHRRHKKRSLLFGTDGKTRNKTKGSNNRSVNKEKSGGRRSKGKGGNIALLGF